MLIDFIGLFLWMAGFIIGLGAVTVIDLHGFFGQFSTYWTETTIRAHKITKPLIWFGVTLAVLGGVITYRDQPFQGTVLFHTILAVVLILNGLFLSFIISPELLRREKAGKAAQLLPQTMQWKIHVSFLFSFIGWWGSVALFIWYLLNR